MKKIFMFNTMLVGLMLMALAMLAQPVWAQHDFSKPRKLYGYGLDQRYVYFEGRLMSGADARSFEYLGHGYARDRRSVYYCGEVLKGANPRTFRVLGDAEEQPAVIVSDRVTPSNDQRGMADWERFPAELLPGNNLGFGYSKTDYDVYYLGKKINASIASFRVLNFGYAKDAFNIFFQGVEVRGASNSSFKVLIDGYAKDSFSAYYCGEEIPNCNVRRFECMGNGVARDNVNKYYLGKKVEW